MGISIEISFSAQQCCGGLSSKQLGCYNACKLLLPNFPSIQIPTSASQLLCPGEILLMCEEIKSSSRGTPFPL
ncbi:hypothetical protein NC653_021941 [Populus alba x Populus x berolinensis]|uniref:Uncharacterized protein n=1 Tax=Populus alba x Populus x berolinensis TaxID=444605 RepID=A0AAD6VTK3_9ROSI|nr:hypothetical protein NC653_021941 [Populus alba x Populus x berolinensis]